MTFSLSGTCIAKPLLPHNFRKLNRLSSLRVSKALLSVFKWLSWLLTVHSPTFQKGLKNKNSNSMCSSSFSLIKIIGQVQFTSQPPGYSRPVKSVWVWFGFGHSKVLGLHLELIVQYDFVTATAIFFSEILFCTLQVLFLFLLTKHGNICAVSWLILLK